MGALEETFREAPAIEFGQYWLENMEPGFASGRVRMGWKEDRFLFFAELQDREVVSEASERNQALWEMGDVLEMFTGVKNHPSYLEYHTAPNGQILQLLWPDAEALAAYRIQKNPKPYMIYDDLAVAHARLVNGGWQVYGEVPAASLPGAGVPLRGTKWEINFGRYDYARNGELVLSATSPLTQLLFHRRPEWREITFR